MWTNPCRPGSEIYEFRNADARGDLGASKIRKKGNRPASEGGNEPDLTTYVASQSLHRRHLSTSQRAMIAEKIARNASEAARVRELAKYGKAERSKDRGGRMSRGEAAALLNVGMAILGRARQVRRDGIPELAEKVERGEMTVAEASRIAKAPKTQQREAMQTQATVRTGMTRRHPLDRVGRAIDSIENMTEIITGVAGHLGGDPRQIEWASRLRAARTRISQFIAKCEIQEVA